MTSKHTTTTKILHGDVGTMKNKVVTGLTKVSKQRNLKEFGEMIRVQCKSAEQIAHGIEGCWCHPGVWTKTTSHKRKCD